MNRELRDSTLSKMSGNAAFGVNELKALEDNNEQPLLHAAVHVLASGFERSRHPQAAGVAAQLLHTRNLVVEGVAGIGKTYLIEEVVAQLRALSTVERVVCDLQELRSADPDGRDYSAKVTQALDSPSWPVPSPLIVLHPSSSYEELILGLRPVGGNGFAYHAGPLLRAILSAATAFAHGCDAPHLLVLDEINRCNLPSVLGELMLLIDPSRRVSREEFERLNSLKGKEDQEQLIRRGKALRLSHLKGALLGQVSQEKERGQGQGHGSGGDKGDSNKEPEQCKHDLIWVPDNLLILGTMNSSDRSILGFDQALRRRFPPHRLDPHTVQKWEQVLLKKYESDEISKATYDIAVSEITAWAAVNVLLRARIGPDAMIGHSYIYDALAECGSSADEETIQAAFARAWEFGILPQVIHAAESARELEFVTQMMEPAVSGQAHRVVDDQLAQYSDSTGNSEVLLGCIQTISGENDMRKDLSDKVGRFRHAMASGAMGASQCCKRALALVGRGHGKRLLIVDRTNTSSNDKKEKNETGPWREVFGFAAKVVDPGGAEPEAGGNPE